MVRDVVLLVIGLLLLIKGGDMFVSSAVRLSELLRLPRIVIGSTLVSLATTTPELVVSIMAGVKGEPGLAIGNAVGSVICNIGLIMGVTASMKHVQIHREALRTPLIVLFLAGVLLLLMTMDLVLSRWQGIVLLGIGVCYFVYDFVHHWRDRKPQDAVEAGAIEKGLKSRFAWLETPWGSGLKFVLAAGVIVAWQPIVSGFSGEHRECA